jgi:hypothetical protein
MYEIPECWLHYRLKFQDKLPLSFSDMISAGELPNPLGLFAQHNVLVLELLLSLLAILDIGRRGIPTCEASLFIQNRIKAGAMRSGKNLIGTVRIELCARSFILRVYNVLTRQPTLMFISSVCSE